MMKREWISLLGLALATTGFASVSSERSTLLLKSEVRYTSQGKEVTGNRELLMETTDRSWTALITPKDGVTLLGRILDTSEKTLKLEYLLVDTNKENPVVATPTMVARLGQKAEVAQGSGATTVSISLTADRPETPGASSISP